MHQAIPIYNPKKNLICATRWVNETQARVLLCGMEHVKVMHFIGESMQYTWYLHYLSLEKLPPVIVSSEEHWKNLGWKANKKKRKRLHFLTFQKSVVEDRRKMFCSFKFEQNQALQAFVFCLIIKNQWLYDNLMWFLHCNWQDWNGIRSSNNMEKDHFMIRMPLIQNIPPQGYLHVTCDKSSVGSWNEAAKSLYQTRSWIPFHVSCPNLCPQFGMPCPQKVALHETLECGSHHWSHHPHMYKLEFLSC